jgi:hypothetical protein
VAETGQPYAFTGDDPLNQTDPLGLTGSALAQKDYLNDVNATKKYCKAHPNAKGHSCGGLLHEIVGTLDKGRHVAAAVGKKIETHPLASASIVVGTALLLVPVVGDAAGGAIDTAAAGDLGLDVGGASSAVSTVRAAAGYGLVVGDTGSCVAQGDAGSCFSAGAGILSLEDPILEPVALPVAIGNALFDLAR